VESLQGFLENMPDINLNANQLNVGLQSYGQTLTKFEAMEVFQEFNKCSKSIALTSSCEVKGGKINRKLGVGEIVQILESSVDAGMGLDRVRCRALADHLEGWATVLGNHGTTYLEKTEKPYHCCVKDSELQSAFENGSSAVRTVRAGEVFEVIEGPRQEQPVEITRVYCKAAKDGKVGWVTLRNSEGDAFECLDTLACQVSVALTSEKDISIGKTICKLNVGESLDLIEGPIDVNDGEKILVRCKARTKKENKQGWATMIGNQGTVYLEKNEKYYVCKHGLPLERSANGSGTIRVLDEGEMVETLDAPKKQSVEGICRMKGRSLVDDLEGWLTLTQNRIHAWSPHYVCRQSTVFQDKLKIAGAKTLRHLDVDELLYALEAPVWEEDAGIMRVRARAENDGIVGFVTIKGNQGTVMLESIPWKPR